jgi:hypothetical protein
VVLAMITHCKELREIGVVLDYRKESRVHTLDGRDDLRRRWKATRLNVLTASSSGQQ